MSHIGLGSSNTLPVSLTACFTFSRNSSEFTNCESSSLITSKTKNKRLNQKRQDQKIEIDQRGLPKVANLATLVLELCFSVSYVRFSFVTYAGIPCIAFFSYINIFSYLYLSKLYFLALALASWLSFPRFKSRFMTVVITPFLMTIHVSSRQKYLYSTHTLYVSMSLQLRPRQLEAVQAWAENNYRGAIIFPTGTGKTEIAIGCHRSLAIQFPGYRTLFLVPRQILVEQTSKRFEGHGFRVSRFYGLEKDLSGDIVVATYQSLYDRLSLLEKFNLIIFDEVHLVSETAQSYSLIVTEAARDTSKALLALTATINPEDEKYATILSACPIVDSMTIGEAIDSGHLTKVRVIDESVDLDFENQAKYQQLSAKIRDLSSKMKTSDPKTVSSFLKGSNPQLRAWAGAWYDAVRQRTDILNIDTEKLVRVGELFTQVSGKTLVFAERQQTLFVLKKLFGAKFDYIVAGTPKPTRELILNRWGKDYKFLGTIHTLDIGFDVPDCENAIVIASNRNPNQIVQRIGRIVRLHHNKTEAKIYVVWAKNTKEKEVYNAILRSTQRGLSYESELS